MNTFIETYLNNANIATPADFILAVQQKYDDLLGAIPSIDVGLINEFYENLKKFYSEEGCYTVDDLYGSFVKAEKDNGIKFGIFNQQ